RELTGRIDLQELGATVLAGHEVYGDRLEFDAQLLKRPACADRAGGTELVQSHHGLHFGLLWLGAIPRRCDLGRTTVRPSHPSPYSRSSRLEFDRPTAKDGTRPHHASTQGRFLPLRAGGGGTERSAVMIHFRDSAGSMTSSISK